MVEKVMLSFEIKPCVELVLDWSVMATVVSPSFFVVRVES